VIKKNAFAVKNVYMGNLKLFSNLFYDSAECSFLHTLCCTSGHSLRLIFSKIKNFPLVGSNGMFLATLFIQMDKAMFEKRTKGVLRKSKENEDYSLLKTACLIDGKDWFTLGHTQSFKKFHKKISLSNDYFFRVATYIYYERTN
jgi:hypothetical protein